MQTVRRCLAGPLPVCAFSTFLSQQHRSTSKTTHSCASLPQAHAPGASVAAKTPPLLRSTGQKTHSRASLPQAHAPGASVPAKTPPLLRSLPPRKALHAVSVPALHAPAHMTCLPCLAERRTKHAPVTCAARAKKHGLASASARDPHKACPCETAGMMNPPVRNGTSQTHPRPPEQCCRWGLGRHSRRCPTLLRGGGDATHKVPEVRDKVPLSVPTEDTGMQGRRQAKFHFLVRGRTIAKFHFARG